MGGGGPSKTVTQQTPQIPPELQAMLGLAENQMKLGLDKAPITGFMDPMIENILGPNQATLDALDYFKSIAGGGATGGIMDAFQKLQLPLIQQQAMQSGLGRSGALLDAEAIGQGSQIMNALQLQSAGAGAEASIGQYLQGLAQEAASAPYKDFLRRQGITEELLSGATGAIPSTIGQNATQKQNNAGLWGWLLGVGPGGGK